MKLIEFYEAMSQPVYRKVQLATDRSVMYSDILTNSQPVTGRLVEKWLESWAF